MPDRHRQLAGDVDLGDLGAALAAEPALVSLVALCVGRVAERVHGRLEQRPAQVAGPLLGKRPPPVGLARLHHPGAKARIAGELGGVSKRLISPISAAIVKARTQPIPGTVRSFGT